ncbi:MAG: hypothetical protein M3463_03715 [Verrucomicrobiota bacterium]|nr:hypothetical protein [Verrucomicrobiota bacterium]
MNRSRWLLLTLLVVLGVANLGYHFWRNRGLITVHADDRPVLEVIRAIERQGGVVLRTNLDPATRVRMHVDKVPLAEALETLATLTDTRWRLTYFLADDEADVQAAIAKFTAGSPPEGWKTAWVPMPPMGDEEGAAPDPRRDEWQVKAPAEKKIQAYLEEAARQVSAGFAFPESWNPEVPREPPSGEITKVVPKLARAVNGAAEEVFLLTQNRRERAEGEPRERSGDPRPSGEFNRDAMIARMQASIDKLPPEKRAAAQKEFDERRKLFSGIRDLPQEERRAKMEEIFNRPEMQERFEKKMMEREARSSPQQRIERARNYIERKTASRQGGAGQ